MQSQPLTITVHMVCSLDGFIAKKDNSVSWFNTSSTYENGIELTEQQTESFLQSIDCYVMGANTYLHAIELAATYGWGYGDTSMIVLSHRALPLQHSKVDMYSGDLNQLVKEQLKPTYKNVWISGGAMVARQFIQLELADEIRLSILPIILGDGIALFDVSLKEQALHLKDVNAYKSGIVEMIYEIKE